MATDEQPKPRAEREDGDGAFQRFESLAKKLVRVPKREIDERAKAYQRKRKR